MQKYYVDGIDARPLVAKIPLFMKLCAFLLLMNVSVTFSDNAGRKYNCKRNNYRSYYRY